MRPSPFNDRCAAKTKDTLSIKELFEHGRTLMYSDLPEVLWALTGYRIKELDKYQKFGDLRNTIVHFAAPDCEASAETLRFALEVFGSNVRNARHSESNLSDYRKNATELRSKLICLQRNVSRSHELLPYG